MLHSVDEYRNSANGIVERLTQDPIFRQRLLADPRQALASAGLEYARDEANLLPSALLAPAKTKCPTKSTCSKTCGWKSCGNSCINSCQLTDKKIAGGPRR